MDVHHILKTSLEQRYKSQVYVYSFDESLNSVTQTSEMDLYIRYWDKTENVVKVRYYGSSFLGHGRHNDILNQFTRLTRSLKSEALYQFSMNGPTVNLKFFKEFAADFKEGNFHSLVDIGSYSACCSRCLQDRCREVGMGPEEIFESCLYHPPWLTAPREDYESVTGSSKYPLIFCATQ